MKRRGTTVGFLVSACLFWSALLLYHNEMISETFAIGLLFVSALYYIGHAIIVHGQYLMKEDD